MVITDFLERNARLYGSDIALVEVNPSEERDSAVTWREGESDRRGAARCAVPARIVVAGF